VTRFLRAKEVLKRTGLRSRVTLWRYSQDPNSDFPRPRQLGTNTIGWDEAELEAWLASRPFAMCVQPKVSGPEQDQLDAAAAT